MLNPQIGELKDRLTHFASVKGTINLDKSHIYLLGIGYDVTRDLTLELLRTLYRDGTLTDLGSHDTHGAPVFKYNF